MMTCIRAEMTKNVVLQGIVEADETYSLVRTMTEKAGSPVNVDVAQRKMPFLVLLSGVERSIA